MPYTKKGGSVIIDLSQPHPYREWNIAAETKVQHTDGQEY